MPRVVHFEIGTADPEQSATFYQNVFGWTFQRWEGGDQDYWLIKTGEPDAPGIDGGMLVYPDGAPRTVNTVMVDSVDEAVEKIVAAGGKVSVPKTPISEMGAVAYCTDPSGVLFGVFETMGEG